MTENPYASPTSDDAADDDAIPRGGVRTAWWADNDRLDRIWRHANLTVWLLGMILLLPTMTPDTPLAVGLVVAALLSAILTLFFVMIPSRVALNVIIRGRRRRYFKETVVCCFTFCILCWVAYLFLHYPDPYP